MSGFPLTLRTSIFNPSHDLSDSHSSIYSPINETTSTLRSTLDQWKATRALLSATIQSYLASCTSLHAACSLPMRHPSERVLAKGTMVAIDSELESLAAEEVSLCKMRTSLVAIRNHSPALAQINMLPSEILASVFALSKVHCVQDEDKLSAYNVAHVCTYWRNIAINLSNLWNHIDVGPGTSGSLAGLLLKRTGSHPIHLHVHEPRPANDVPTAERQVAEVLNVLGLHGHRIRTLDLETHSYSRSLVGPVLNQWLGMGDSSTTKSLLVYRPKAGMMLTPDGYNSNVTLASRSQNASAVLGTLTKLHLQNVRFDWDSSAYRNLVDLQLSCFCSPITISMPELMSILSENPRLSIFKLSSVRITSPDDWVCPSPVMLKSLRILNLFHIEPSGLRLFLTSIRLPTSPIEVGIGPTPFRQIYDELKSLLINTNLISMYCWQDKEEPFTGWVSMLRLVPHLRNLVMDELQMTDKPFVEVNMEDSRPLSPSHLDYAIFLDSVVTLDGLKALVDARGIHSLRLERCKSFDNEPDGLENIRVSLVEAYPELECVVTDNATTGQLDYCKIFDR